MKEREGKTYHCEFCRKYYMRKHHCLKHEKYCNSNPINHHACFDCKNLLVDKTDEGYKCFTCKVNQNEMYTYKAEKHKSINLDFMVKMPNACADYTPDLITSLLSNPTNG